MNSPYVLGPLCKRGHTHESEQQSLRYASTRQCVACMKARHTETHATYYAENKEKLKAKSRKYHHENRDARLVKMRVYQETDSYRASRSKHFETNKLTLYTRTAAWRKRNKQKIKAYNKAYYAARKEQAKERCRAWRKLNAARSRAYNAAYGRQYRTTQSGQATLRACRRRNRALRASVVCVPYTDAELLAHFELFDCTCAYCGCAGKLEGDHYVPVKRGGADALFNLVPACLPCNRRKNASDPVKWYAQQAFYCSERLTHLDHVLDLAFRKVQNTL